MQLMKISPLSDDVRALVAQLDAYMDKLYPADSNHFDSVESLAAPNVHVVGVLEDETVRAIGAVKQMSDDGDYGEIKRVYVPQAYQGQGWAKKIMSALEQHLLAAGIECARLETGIYQLEAIGLYRKLGYLEREPYGPYQPDPLSLFMQKQLSP